MYDDLGKAWNMIHIEYLKAFTYIHKKETWFEIETHKLKSFYERKLQEIESKFEDNKQWGRYYGYSIKRIGCDEH